MNRKIALFVLAIALLVAIALPAVTPHLERGVEAASDGPVIAHVLDFEAPLMVADPECPSPTGEGCGGG